MAKPKKKEPLAEIKITKSDIMDLFKELEKQGLQIDYEDEPKPKKAKKKNKK